ncbi:Predicted nucleotidyltransferase [Alkalithermobacter thermoalcaliphilus JW-YL-7 = DSM 7308]|uniref:tRNA(Met) cytidine acetate ligase n=1 Tax=Alkalithermobacter thermoalcaliphilus JW-YL-7 = DSM 7308 TaxID=1121328 RepID=A0A150FPX8_CLOPD|nr:UPF0348 protein [[Clostridium] paradoxum JW-YL-7 = DSM 7308]SHK95656.1 Predicted nucleotidyltransferase [[Clostridium] paradoxum JW-YL-7 = DSM 7308]
MKVLGVIVEYNPFHNGHLHHLLESKKITNSTHTVAVMSGHFLQRGEPALFDKWTRAHMAIKCGVDLVIELPCIYSSQSAEFFAKGAIATLNATNVIDCICFGSEIGNIDILYKISEILVYEPVEFKIKLKEYLKLGYSFPVARSKALFDYMKENNLACIDEQDLLDVLNNPNNILGIEYIKSIITSNSKIKPYTIQRIKAHYNCKNIESEICSATAIREFLRKNDNINDLRRVVPYQTFEIMENQIHNKFLPMFDKYFFETIIYTIIKEGLDIKRYLEVNEGLENKILSCAFKSSSFDDLLSNIKSKRYTLTKVKRTIMNILLGIEKKDMEYIKSTQNTPYIRVLAFNEKGRQILKKIKQDSNCTIINKLSSTDFNNPILNTFLKYDIKSTDIYNIFYYSNNKYMLKGSMDYYISPIYVK